MTGKSCTKDGLYLEGNRYTTNDSSDRGCDLKEPPGYLVVHESELRLLPEPGVWRRTVNTMESCDFKKLIMNHLFIQVTKGRDRTLDLEPDS